MAIDLSFGETKSNIDLSKEAKGFNTTLTWDEADYAWDEADHTWDNPKFVLSRESKSFIDLSKESK